MHVTERRQITYRVPVTAVLLLSLPLLVFGVVARYWPVLGAILWASFIARNRLELHEREAVIRAGRTERLPWASVTGVHRTWPGGIYFTTTAYRTVVSPTPCSWWGGPATRQQIAEVEQWWIDHRGPSWAPPPPFTPPPPAPPRPPVRHRTSAIAPPLAVIGLLAAVLNGAALAAAEPDFDHPGWAIVAAVAAGLVLGGAWAVKLRWLLARSTPPGAAANARPGTAARPLGMVAGAAALVALGQWLGSASGIGAILLVSLGVAAAITGTVLAGAARRFERRTGRLLLSTNPLRRGFGLETGPPRSGTD